MLIETSVDASSTDLTQVSAIAAELGDLYSPTLPWERWIRVASRRVLSYVDPSKISLLTTWEERLEGSDGELLVLSRRPVINSIAHPVAVTFNGETFTDFTVDKRAGMLYSESIFTRLHTLGLGPWAVEPTPTGEALLAWVVTYQAGYEPAGATSGVTMPDEIEQACIEVLKSMALRSRRDPSIRSEAVGSMSVTYADESGKVDELPATARALLEAWR